MSSAPAQPSAQARLLAVARAVGDALVCADTDGRITMWTGGAEAMFGYGEQEALGRPLTDLMPERYRELHRAGFRRVVAGEPPKLIGHHNVELEALRKDGTEFPVELALSEGRHDGERFFVGVLRDIADRRQAQEDLRRSNLELQQFAYTASHDLSEPLRIVDGYLGLLRRRYADRLDAEADEFIDHAVDAAARMRDLIDALLRYAQAGSAGVQAEPVTTAEIVREARDSLAVSIGERNVTVEVGELPRVAGDPALLRQLFQNLLANAVRHASTERPRVRVTAHPRNGSVEFSIADNGPGVPPAERQQIFEMFTRGTSAAGEERSAGIGLAICKRVVERHGGTIRFEEAPGGGADVRFTLPGAFA